MNKPFFHVRDVYPEDVMQLLDIDIKCFDIAWTPEEWIEYVKGTKYSVRIVTCYGVPVSFGVFTLRPDWRAIEVLKVCVKPGFRQKGLSSMLLAEAIKYANSKQHGTRPLKVAIVIPEGQTDPHAGDNLLSWLTAVGFRATAPFIRNHFTRFGQPEDGVKFILERKL